jgi:hypothetical protein
MKFIEDLGAPGLAIAVDLVTLDRAPQYNEIASYVMTGVGYVAGGLGFGGRTVSDFLLKLGIATAPLTARAIYSRVKAPVGQRATSVARLSLHPVAAGSPIRREYQEQFKSGAFAI